MIDVENELRRLYKDALYFHLIRNGYTVKRAVFKVKRILDDK